MTIKVAKNQFAVSAVAVCVSILFLFTYAKIETLAYKRIFQKIDYVHYVFWSLAVMYRPPVSLQDYVDVDRVLLSSRAEVKLDTGLLIQQPTFNDVAKVTRSVSVTALKTSLISDLLRLLSIYLFIYFKIVLEVQRKKRIKTKHKPSREKHPQKHGCC